MTLSICFLFETVLVNGVIKWCLFNEACLVPILRALFQESGEARNYSFGGQEEIGSSLSRPQKCVKWQSHCSRLNSCQETNRESLWCESKLCSHLEGEQNLHEGWWAWHLSWMSKYLPCQICTEEFTMLRVPRPSMIGTLIPRRYHQNQIWYHFISSPYWRFQMPRKYMYKRDMQSRFEQSFCLSWWTLRMLYLPPAGPTNAQQSTLPSSPTPSQLVWQS